MALLLGLAGCSGAPTLTVFGSFFPSWMICVLIGIAAAVAARQGFVAAGLDRSLPAPFAVYLALAVAFSFAAWLLWLE